MAGLEPLLRFWRALDDLFDRVSPTRWGAVISDPRYPAVQEANYARVEGAQAVDLAEIESELLPALARAGCARAHAVVFDPEEQTALIAEASTRGERIVWDLVMEREGPPEPPPEPPPGWPPAGEVQEVIDFDDGFWSAHRGSARLFGVSDEVMLDQLSAMEREVLVPAGRRWFVIRDEAGEPLAFTALMTLEGVGFIDHVLTLPDARRRGYATELTRRALDEAHEAGAERTYLLAEPQGPPAALYARLGFSPVGHLASWISPIDPR